MQLRHATCLEDRKRAHPPTMARTTHRGHAACRVLSRQRHGPCATPTDEVSPFPRSAPESCVPSAARRGARGVGTVAESAAPMQMQPTPSHPTPGPLPRLQSLGRAGVRTPTTTHTQEAAPSCPRPFRRAQGRGAHVYNFARHVGLGELAWLAWDCRENKEAQEHAMTCMAFTSKFALPDLGRPRGAQK